MLKVAGDLRRPLAKFENPARGEWASLTPSPSPVTLHYSPATKFLNENPDIVSYISKAQKGMSQLLQRACDGAREGNSSIKQQVRDTGNKFLNSVEISAQEAVYIVLQLPMRKSSRQVIFINTAPLEERVKLLKPMNEIEKMDDESEEVYSSGLLNRYMKRPSSLENVTLADWAALYDTCQKPLVKRSKDMDTDNLPMETVDDQEKDDKLPDCDSEAM